MIRTLQTTSATKPTLTSSIKTTPTLIPSTPLKSSTHTELNDDYTMHPIEGQNESTAATTTASTQSSTMHCASLSSSANRTVNTVSTNNTFNSLNHNVAADGVQTHASNKRDSNENSIPSGYSVHIKASNSSQINVTGNNNNNNSRSSELSNGTTNNMISSNITPYGSTVSSSITNTSNSSNASSPIPASSNNAHSSAGSFSTATTASTTFNQLPTLTSSDSFSVFNFFEGMSLPPAPTNTTAITSANSSTIAPATNTSQSPLTTALFNTNPPTTSTTTNINPLTSSNIVTDETVAQIVSNTSVPEFLYQLTKMLTDDHRDIIEWSNGKIEVHNPTKLEKEVLNQYFRHSKYASFQRQLNYFGFRKLAGKGKMAPCSYVNENATSDLRSLLRMKRKTSANTKDGKSTDINHNSDTNTNKSGHSRPTTKEITSNKRARNSRQQPKAKHPYEASAGSSGITIAKKSGIRHQLNNFGNTTSSLQNLNKSLSPQISSINNPLVPDPMTTLDPLTIAKAAVGKGVTHQYQSSSNKKKSSRANKAKNSNAIGISNTIMSGIPTDSSNKFTFLDPSQLGMGMESYMSELQTNFRNSLNEANAQSENNNDFNGYNMNQIVNQNNNQCSLPRESSLVDLAIIPSLTSAFPQTSNFTPSYLGLNNRSEDDYGMTFIDFPMDNSTLAPPEE